MLRNYRSNTLSRYSKRASMLKEGTAQIVYPADKLERLHIISQKFMNLDMTWRESLAKSENTSRMLRRGNSVLIRKKNHWNKNDEDFLRKHQADLKKRVPGVLFNTVYEENEIIEMEQTKT